MYNYFCMFVFLVVSVCAAPVQAENTRNPYKVSSIDQFIGNTIVGVTRNSSIWSAYFDRNGYLDFLYSSGERRQGRWYKKSDDTVCFSINQKSGEQAQVCKVISSAGQGLYWRTDTDRIASSQIILILPGKSFADQASYRSNLKDWVGKVIVGRLYNDSKKVWQAVFKHDGFIDFYYSSGQYRSGVYFLYDDTLCIRFTTDDLTHCRKPQVIDGTIAWVNPETEGDPPMSEIVYLHEIQPPAKQYVQEPTSVPRRRVQLQDTLPTARTVPTRRAYTGNGYCSADRLNMLKVACVVVAVGEYACADFLSDNVNASAVSGGSAAAFCNAAAQNLLNGEIDPDILGLAALAGAAIGTGDAMLRENQDSVWGALFKLGGFAGSGYLIAQCMESVENNCY